MRRAVALTTEIALLAGGLLAAAIAATYPLVRHLTTHLPNDLGDPVLVAWTLGWDADAIRHFGVHLFDAPNFFPYTRTLAYSDHLLGIAIFTAPLQWLTANAVLTYNVAFIASFVQAGAGMYLLTRELTGRRDAAALAAFAFAFAPFRIAHLAHLQWLISGWLPISLWALHRYFATRRLAFLLTSAAAYLLQSLTATYFTYFGLLPLFIVAAAETWRVHPPLRRTIGHAAAAAALCAAVMAPIALTYYRARLDHDFVRKDAEIVALSADVSDYLRAHSNIALWRHARPGTGEHELFPGAVALVLAGVAVLGRRHASGGRFAIGAYAAIAAVALVLSLGPRPAAWGHVAPIAGPYQWLLATVPGLDGLRSIARLASIVVLAVCVLAAYGAVRLLDAVPTRARTAVAVVLALAIMAEAWAAPIPTARFAPLAASDERAAYAFLRSDTAGGAILELPMAPADDPRELAYQYLTIWHGHRVVNGSSSYTPALTQLLKSDDQSPLIDRPRFDAAIGLIRNIGVRYVVVHANAFKDAATGRALIAELEGDRRQVAAAQHFGDTIVFTLNAADAGTGSAARPIPIAAGQARASDSADRLALLFDGDRDTRWLTGRGQRGDEWIEIPLDPPRDVSMVRMQTAERSFADYPRELAIEAVEDGGARTLFRGSVLPQFGLGLTAALSYPWIDVPLPPNRARLIRLRQLGITDRLFWSIHELRLEERTH